MAKYVGKRVVPKHCGAWAKNIEYEMLSIVLDEESGESYISKRQVPSGTLLTNEHYWSICSLFSQQIADMGEEFAERQSQITQDNASTLKQIKAGNADTLQKIQTDNDETEKAVKDDNASTKQYVEAGLARAQSDLEAAVSNLNNTNEALNTRMDSIVGGATTDTEVLDARVGADGQTHDSLGAHIRAVGGEVLDYLEEEGYQRAKQTVIAGNEIIETFPSGKSKKTVAQGKAVTESWFSEEGVLLVSKTTSFEGNSIVETIEQQNA